MKLFGRIVMVLVLLSVLAYGSFAFGKYVLSTKLFGDGATGALRTVTGTPGQASVITRKSNWKGEAPRVDVRVLPADKAGPAPGEGALADEDNLSTERDENAADDATRAAQRASDDSSFSTSRAGNSRDDGSGVYSSGDEENRSHRPRKRRRRTTTKAVATPTPTAAAVANDENDPSKTPPGDAAETVLSTPQKSAATSTPAEKTPRSSRRRHRSSKSASSPGASTPRGSSRRESPIPKPEGSSSAAGSSSSGGRGGDSADISPVPKPE